MAPEDTTAESRPAFTARRLTPPTFLLVEIDDVYDEHPFIYAKLIPGAKTVLLLDTGCGGATRRPDASFTRLRDFLEGAPVEDNGGQPLNEDRVMRYVVVLSHCHYDHIFEQFAHDSPILASGYDPSFLAPEKLPGHSLCASLGIRTPSYTPSLRPHQSPILSADGTPLGVTLLHTPGHTPDELALWDPGEGVLYVGDTLYEWAPIIFPNEGSIVVWLESVDFLSTLVEASGKAASVMINCGHKTAMGPALEVLRRAKNFVTDVIEVREEVRRRFRKRGEVHVEYAQEGGLYGLICPERLVLEAGERYPAGE